MSKKDNSNPNVEDVLQGDTEESTAGSSDFFDNLEAQVNGAISDDIPQPETEQVTQEADPGDTGNEVQTDWKAKAENLEKRYGDSTREAQRLKAENDNLAELSKFRPLIEHLKNSPDAVQALRDSIGGKNPRSLTERFGEDFVFDAHEAMSNPESDSGKVLNEYIANTAQQQAAAIINQEKQQFAQQEQQANIKAEAEEFKKRTGMSDAEFNELQARANEHVLTLDDIYFLLNRDKVSKNVADNTKTDMLNQMKQVRDIPQSASNANSPGREAQSPDDKMFDILKGLDEGTDNLFG
tara:strand:+ start:469 stop:1356 length:888 start_codon:yes stop_codon:yes gene_type:complete